MIENFFNSTKTIQIQLDKTSAIFTKPKQLIDL